MRRFLISVALLLSAAETKAAPVTLECEGILPTYLEGFGTSKIDTEGKTTRLIHIDFEAKEASFVSLFGMRSAPLDSQTSEQYVSFTVQHGVAHGKHTVVSESTSINRYTGEISSFYSVLPATPQSVGYTAFRGKCKKAQRQF